MEPHHAPLAGLQERPSVLDRCGGTVPHAAGFEGQDGGEGCPVRVFKRSCVADHGWVLRRRELSDAEWEFVRVLLLVSPRGRKRLDDRLVFNGIVWKFRTGTAWRDVPERYGPWVTLHTWFRRWALDGTFEQMLRAAQARGQCGRGHRLARVGRRHRRSSPPACRRSPERRLRAPGLGRSRGGLTSKIHLACDGGGCPLTSVLTGGNTNDRTQFITVLKAIRVPGTGPGCPRLRPAHVLGDKGYRSGAIRTWLRQRGIRHTIPNGADRIRNRLRRGRHGGRPPAFDTQFYKRRNVVERCFNRLKHCRGIATRYDKTAESFQATLTLASS
ncbi:MULTISPECIES: IS5 family transposase [unclassified Streptomyces]|uniref:IS5 family transposase n=1 Tax=unclassified Streptomyces TaxID=2593676 RepID=UPI0036A910E0